MIDLLRDQYEAYPYPARDPADEKQRLIIGSPSNLPEINHYLFAGRRDFSKPFQALVAGGGTGDGTIMLAQQLADAGTAGRVTYLDLSTASRQIAEARATSRGLKNITFLSGSLLDLPQICEGPFDYIDCCGVLHHLADPAVGLQALKSVLAPGGGMGLMVYAPYGRCGVYETQDLLRRLNNGDSLKKQVETARSLMKSLPETNWLNRNPFIGDHQRSDAELVDLLLHSQDRAFSVEEIFQLVEASGLRLASFIEPARYDPAIYLKDPNLLSRLKERPLAERSAFAEKLAGNFKTHVFYVTGEDTETTARLPESDDDAFWQAVPIFRPMGSDEEFGARLALSLRKTGVLTANFSGLSLRFPLPRLASLIVAQIDGRRCLGDIFKLLKAKDSALASTAFQRQFNETYRVLNGANLLLLRHPPL